MIYADKYDTNNDFRKVGARNVARGTDQELPPGTDTAGPTINWVSIMLELFIAAYHDFEVSTIDFRKAYLNADIGDDNLYVTLDRKTEEMVRRELADVLAGGEAGPLIFKVFKSLYGLKASAMEWYSFLAKLLVDLGFVVSWWDACLFFKLNESGKLQQVVGTHVDDLMVASARGETAVLLSQLKNTKLEFTATQGNKHDYLGVHIEQDMVKGTITLSQPGFLKSLLVDDFGLDDNDVNDTLCSLKIFDKDDDSPLLDAQASRRYRSRLMKIQWLRKTRLDISMPLSVLATRMQAPTLEDEAHLLRLAQYLNSSRDVTLNITKPPLDKNGNLPPFEIEASADASFQSHSDESSHLAYILYVRYMGTLAAGSQKLRGSVPQSSTEAELEALAWTIPAVIPVRGILVEWCMAQPATVIQQDNQSAILIVNIGPGRSKGTRPMRRRVFKAHFLVKDGEIVLKKVPTEIIYADNLTKPKNLAIFAPWVIWIQNVPKTVPKGSSPFGV
jgi:hypothetical protein